MLLFSDDKVYLLCEKPTYTVGRNKTCDIVGESTQSSLGRCHATLHPYEDRVEIIDTESKYGTYVNEQINSNVKISPKTAVPLKDGDIVRFGFIDFTWKLEKADVIVVASTLTDHEKENLRTNVSTLDGQLIDQWSDTCTHLVVRNLSFTVKVLQALCHAIPIVKPEYFKAMLLAIRNKGTPPNVKNFQPVIVERLGGDKVSLQANIDRKRLFVGKTFIFMTSRHMETFKGVIECGMGQCSSFDLKQWQRRSLVKPGFIVIANTSSSQSQVATQTANDLNDFLRSKGSRMIPESEISLAILHCSLDKFCNPSHTLADNFESKSRIVPSTLIVGNTPVNQNEGAASTLTNSINVPETNEQPNTLASTVPSNSTDVINLMDDDDDVMLVQSVDLAMSMGEINKGKRKNSTEDEEPSMKKLNLDKGSDSTMKSNDNFVFNIPQRSTRSSKNANISTMKPATENQIEKTSAVQRDKKLTTKQDTESGPSTSRSKSNLQSRMSNQRELTEKSSTEISIIERPESQARLPFANNSQSELVTSTQIEAPKRKRIAHRPSSTFAGNNSDSDDELFNFTAEPSMKKSKPTKGSDSDSDDNMNYPLSSRAVAPISVPLRPFTQSSQIAPDSWLSRPTPSQCSTDTTIRSKPNKSKEKSKSANISAGWQIGQYCISTPPIQIPTQGWCSKDTIKSLNLESEIKQEDDKTLLVDSKWMDSFKCGIQVITKSMNLMSTSGKVFKVSVLLFKKTFSAF